MDLNNGGGRREVVTEGIIKPTAIAVDWVANNLYVLESEGHRIDLVSITGGHQKVITSRLVKPTDIAVDPNTG